MRRRNKNKEKQQHSSKSAVLPASSYPWTDLSHFCVGPQTSHNSRVVRADAKPQLNGCFWHISSGSDHCRLSGWVKGEQRLCYEETKTSPSGVLPDPDVTCRLTVYSPCKIQAQSTALPPPPRPHHKNDTRPETLQHSPLELFCSYLLSNKDGEEISHIHLKTGDSSNFYVLISKLQFSTFLYFFCCRFWVFHHQFVFCDSAAKTIIVAFSISEPSYTFDHKIKEQKSTAEPKMSEDEAER